MCMLFIKPANFTLPENYFSSLQDHNADGVAFYNLAEKSLFKSLCYDEAAAYLEKHHDRELICHFRYGTSGNKSLEQLHGFDIVNDEYIFFHNGVLKTFSGIDGLSDTQQFVNFINSNKLTIANVIAYLEKYEKSSRFLIVKKEDNSIIIPNCAKWNSPININGTDITFSNSYAIDYRLLYGDSGKNNLWYEDYGIYDYEDYGMLDDGDSDEDLTAELEYLIKYGSRLELSDFLSVNAYTVAKYLKEMA